MAEIGTAWAPSEDLRRAAFYNPPTLLATLPPEVTDRGPAPKRESLDNPRASSAEGLVGSAATTPDEGMLHALVVGGDGAALAALLGAQRVEATCVDRVHHAFAMLEAFVFDVIAVNVDLGADSDLDGLEFCHAVRRQRRRPGEACPPILMLSARPTPLEEARAALAGSSAYLGTPVQPLDLARVLTDTGLRPGLPSLPPSPPI
jgi:CheY-like chemotaxis protein